MLYLHYNKIAHIEPPPASVPSNSLASLRSLSLSHNELSSVPAGLMSRLTGLSLLFLENNRLEELPDAVCGLARLELLRVDCNRLRRLPDVSGMTQLIGTHARALLVAFSCRTHSPRTRRTRHTNTHARTNTTYQPSTATTTKSNRFRGTCCN